MGNTGTYSIAAVRGTTLGKLVGDSHVHTQYRYHTAPRIELSLTMGCCSVLAWAPSMPRPGFSGTSARCRVVNMAMIRLRMQEAIA